MPRFPLAQRPWHREGPCSCLLLPQLSAVEAGGSTAFIAANFSVPVVKVSPSPAWFRGAKPQLWGSLLCLGTPAQFWVANPNSRDPGHVLGGSNPQS